MDPTYYRVNVSKVKYLECWRGTQNLFEFVLICFIKTFRLSFLAQYAIMNEGYKRLAWNELRADARESLRLVREEFEAAGFRYCFCYCYPTIGTMQATEMVLLSDDGQSCASVKHERHTSGSFVNSLVNTTIVSELSTGSFLSTCTRQDVMPPEFLSERHPKYSTSRLAQRHRERIAEASPAYTIPLRDDYDVQRRTLDIEQRIFRYSLDRGLLIPLTAAQAERYKTLGEPRSTTPAAPAMPASPATHSYADAGIVDLGDQHVYDAALAADSSDAPVSRYPGVIAELERIRNKKGSWLSGAVILGISILLFVGIGAAQWDWKFVLLLIPVLLFHELGHFVAMRIFKYRNLKMFFIPLLGAAVTGQNYNVAGWKKVIVSLAGPVPGIFLGSVLGIVALVLGDQELLLEAAALTVFLNAFNLLPFLPLDGGWIVHVLLFSRHHILDAVFRFLAAVILILSGLLGFRFLVFVGVMMLFGLRSAYRVARVAAEIRDAGIDTSSPDGLSIPIPTADAIISRLDAAAPLPVPDALKAQQTLQVFESVNARPPGVLGTLALAGVHGGSVLAAIIFFATFTIARQADLRDYSRGAATAPRNSYECGTAKQWPPSADRLPTSTASTIVATFASVDEAEAAFAERKVELPAGVIVTQFGQSVLLTLDAESQQIDAFTARFESAGAAVGISTPGVPLMVSLDTTVATKERAKLLEQEVKDYFALPIEMSVIPPWAAEHKLTEPQWTARRTYQELVKFTPLGNKRYFELCVRMEESLRRHDQAKGQEAMLEQRALVRELQQQYNKQLLERDDLDKNVIEIYSRKPQHRGFSADAEAKWNLELRAWHVEMGSQMGQLTLDDDGRPIPSDYGIIGRGSVKRTGLMLRFVIGFLQPDDGAIAITKWLRGHDCIDAKYAFGDDE